MRTEKQLLALAEARKHIKHKPLSQETKRKIGDANRKQIEVKCFYCNKSFTVKPSKLKKNKRLFCCRDCYFNYVKEKLPLEEQNAYKGVRKPNETKQVYHRNYCKRHPDIISHLKANRYAREKGAVGSHTLQEWEELKNKHNNKCAICGKEAKLTKDHIIPLSKGGSNYISNIQPLCRNCNSKKNNKIIHDNPELLEKVEEE